MALLHAFKGVPSTFGDLADQLLRLVVARLSAASRVDVVFDCYNDMSIKSFERNKRAGTESLLVAIAGSTTKCPKKWSKALHVSANKAAIVSFLVEEWQKVKYAPLIAQRSLFVTSGEQCWLFRTEASDGTVTVQRFAVPELECSHEEADTRMLLHAQHAANTGQASVIIRSPDTDVAVIACSLASQIQARLIFQTGTAQRMRYLDLTAIAASFGQGVATSLIGMHSMTGCDTTSAFSGRGKKAAFALMKTPRFRRAMGALGMLFEVSEQVLADAEAFLCTLYGKPNFNDINELRYHLSCTRPGNTSHGPGTHCHP